LRRLQNRPADAVAIERDERAIAFLNFDDAVLNSHKQTEASTAPRDVPAGFLKNDRLCAGEKS
jgi:hypothetical protein